MSKEIIDFTQPQPYVVDVLKYISSGSVLDLGAGWGRNTRFFLERGFTVTAVDNSDDAISALRAYKNTSPTSLKIMQCDIANFVPGQSYDLVLCTMSLHFLKSQAEFISALTRIQDSTKENGINIISLYTSRNASGLRPYMPVPGALTHYYDSWQILDTHEGFGRWSRLGGNGPIKRDYVERVTARKPKAG